MSTTGVMEIVICAPEKRDPLTLERSGLYEDIWANSRQRTADKYGISTGRLKKICDALTFRPHPARIGKRNYVGLPAEANATTRIASRACWRAGDFPDVPRSWASRLLLLRSCHLCKSKRANVRSRNRSLARRRRRSSAITYALQIRRRLFQAAIQISAIQPRLTITIEVPVGVDPESLRSKLGDTVQEAIREAARALDWRSALETDDGLERSVSRKVPRRASANCARVHVPGTVKPSQEINGGGVMLGGHRYWSNINGSVDPRRPVFMRGSLAVLRAKCTNPKVWAHNVLERWIRYIKLTCTNPNEFEKIFRPRIGRLRERHGLYRYDFGGFWDNGMAYINGQQVAARTLAPGQRRRMNGSRRLTQLRHRSARYRRTQHKRRCASLECRPAS